MRRQAEGRCEAAGRWAWAAPERSMIATPMDPEKMKRRLEAVRADYRLKAPAKIAAVEALWSRVKGSAPDNELRDELRGELMSATHTLLGSAPTLGCEALGAAARELDTALRASFARDGTLCAADTQTIDRLVARLGQSLD